MTDYELRAEYRPADPSHLDRIPWHLTRCRAHLAICGHAIQSTSETRPLADADATAIKRRCTACWEWWSEVRLIGEPRGD